MDSEDDVPIGKGRAQRKASIASHEGIKRGIRSESDSSSDSDEEMRSVGSRSDESDASESIDDSDADKKSRKVTRKVVKKAAPKKKAATPKKKVTPKSTPSKAPSRKKAISESEDEADSEIAQEDSSNQNEQKVLKQVQNRSLKEQMVADILCRWWYAMPDWPPADFDYGAKMKEEKLRLVSLDKWEDEPDTDPNGFLKCYALTQYKGQYRDAVGNLRDLRPLQGKPCFSELIQKSEKELQLLLTTALTNQMQVLSASGEKNIGAILADLKDRLKNVGSRKSR